MTDKQNLQTLKTLAKRYARACRIPHHQALDIVAGNLGFPHWKAATNAAKEGWLPSPEQLSNIEKFVSSTNPTYEKSETGPDDAVLFFGDDDTAEKMSIGPHSFWVEDALGDVHLVGKGWHIQVPEAPSAEPIIEITDKRFKSNPVRDPEFVAEALKIALARAEIVQAQTSSDWPRRSTKPDADGRVRHPLSGGLSKEWFCLHCDGKFTGTEIARNMWHCPDCSATPIDIFSSPFWLGEPTK
ncbi:MAG: hypothetical protein ABJJ37_11775 [Roseibium sp.]